MSAPPKPFKSNQIGSPNPPRQPPKPPKSLPGSNFQQGSYPPQKYDVPYTSKTPAPRAPETHSSNKEERFAPTANYTDKWAAILFGISMVVFFVFVGFGSTVVVDPAKDGSTHVHSGVAFLAGVSLVGGFGLSLIYFWLMNTAAGRLIKVQCVAYIVMCSFVVVVCFFNFQWLTGIIILILTALFAFMLWSRRHHIPFAALMLETVTDIVKKYPGMIVSGVVGMIVQAIFSACFLSALIGCNYRWPDHTYAIDLTLLFIYYWFNQVVSNVIHVTCSGVYGTYYFLGISDGGGHVNVNVVNPTIKSAKRAMTTSFGSVCYGSLLIAIIQTIRAVIRQFSDSARREGNPIGVFCACICDCIMGIIESIVKYFIAIYGKDYCSAGRDTVALFNSKGMEIIINDDFIGIVLTMGALMVGLLNSVLTVIICLLFINFLSLWFVCLISIVLGYTEFCILAKVISSGTASTFVCIAEDPEAIRRTKPELFQKIRDTYPGVNFYA